MVTKKVCAVLSAFLLSIAIASIARGQRPMGEVMCACPGLSKPLGNAASCEEACYGRRSTGGAAADARAREEAAARAREEAAAREREEAERAERERVAEEKRKKDKEEADARFIRDRNDAAKTLKGSSGTATSDEFGLKGSSGVTDLRDAVAEPGLKGSSPNNRSDQSKQAAAWRQLRCATSIFKNALSAVDQKGGYDTYGALSVDAMQALDGKRVDTPCEDAPNVPSIGGEEVDVDKLRVAEKNLIERGNALVDRMKKGTATPTTAQATKPAQVPPTQQPCTGTRAERMKCTQLRLNEVNSKKLLGQTTAAISEEEKNREELGNLVLINNGLEKGDLSVIVNTNEEAPIRRHRPGKPVPPP